MPICQLCGNRCPQLRHSHIVPKLVYKRIRGHPSSRFRDQDIAEVKNAYEIYEMMNSLNPYSVDDLLNAHAVMTHGLTEESGRFRSGPVGVVDKQGNILHFGTLPDYAPGLTKELLNWVEESDLHMLIKPKRGKRFDYRMCWCTNKRRSG